MKRMLPLCICRLLVATCRLSVLCVAVTLQPLPNGSLQLLCLAVRSALVISVEGALWWADHMPHLNVMHPFVRACRQLSICAAMLSFISAVLRLTEMPSPTALFQI